MAATSNNTTPAAAAGEKQTKKKLTAMKRLEIKPYNDKSFIVVGSETKKLSQQLKSLGGRFCFLPATEKEHDGYYQPAWVYSINKYNQVIEQLESLMSNKPAPAKAAKAAKSAPAPESKPVKATPAKEPVKKEPAKPPIRIKPIEF